MSREAFYKTQRQLELSDRMIDEYTWEAKTVDIKKQMGREESKSKMTDLEYEKNYA